MTTQPWLLVFPLLLLLLVLLVLLLVLLYFAKSFSSEDTGKVEACTHSLFLASANERKRPSEKRKVDTIYEGQNDKQKIIAK